MGSQEPILSDRVSTWLQVAANIGILLGLVFVGFQIRQDRELKRIELVSRAYTDIFERELAALGDEPYRAIVKAATNPAALTNEEQYIYRKYLDIVLIGWDRRRVFQREGIFDGSWIENTNIPYEFRTKEGIRYLENALSSGYFPKELAARLEQILADPSFQQGFFNDTEGESLAGEQ